MTLAEYRSMRMPELSARQFARSSHWARVTLVAYAFPADEEGPAFDAVAFAVLHSWFVLGKLKTVFVVPHRFKKAEEFAVRHSDCVELQEEPSLVPGKIETMSADCDGKLARRFATEYCLVVQDDGFPLKDTLDEFLGKWDFVGAPYVRSTPWRNLFAAVIGYHVLNGGFSLRSKRICEAAAEWWTRKYKRLHPSQMTVDDLYYTQTLPLRHLSYRFRFRLPSAPDALRFSYDALVPQPVNELPLGFHRAETFEKLDGGFAISKGTGLVS